MTDVEYDLLTKRVAALGNALQARFPQFTVTADWRSSRGPKVEVAISTKARPACTCATDSDDYMLVSFFRSDPAFLGGEGFARFEADLAPRIAKLPWA